MPGDANLCVVYAALASQYSHMRETTSAASRLVLDESLRLEALVHNTLASTGSSVFLTSARTAAESLYHFGTPTNQELSISLPA